jgi:hypothetical protein
MMIGINIVNIAENGNASTSGGPVAGDCVVATTSTCYDSQGNYTNTLNHEFAGPGEVVVDIIEWVIDIID